jgi:hypothetical protein
VPWKKGPLPAGTWNWGGVALAETLPYGFYFADFCGDHAKLVGVPGPDGNDRIVKSEEIVWYDNSLTLPPGSGFEAKRLSPNDLPKETA